MDGRVLARRSRNPRSETSVIVYPNVYTNHTYNDAIVRELVTQHLGRHDSLLSVAKKRKLRWFGHVVRAEATLANTILQGTVEGTRKRGRPKRVWMDEIKNWTGRNVEELLRLAENRSVWSRVVMNIASPQWPHGFGT